MTWSGESLVNPSIVGLHALATSTTAAHVTTALLPYVFVSIILTHFHCSINCAASRDKNKGYCGHGLAARESCGSLSHQTAPVCCHVSVVKESRLGSGACSIMHDHHHRPGVF
jgi:hypothetical protein